MVGDDEDRPRRSWSEIDKLRDRPRSRADDRRPRGEAARVRSSQATKQYLDRMGRDLFQARGDEGAEAHAVRAAHGTPELVEACRAYLAARASPEDADLARLFLDAEGVDVQAAGLEALARLHAAGRLPPTSGMRTQLRILAESPDDDVAYLAEEILGAL